MTPAPTPTPTIYTHQLPSKRTLIFTLPIDLKLLDDLEVNYLVDFYHYLRHNAEIAGRGVFEY
jgi:hypothetical protein